MIPKDSEELGLYLNSFTISRDAWVLQNCRLIDKADETSTTTVDNSGDTGRIIAMNLNNFGVGRLYGPAVCFCDGNLYS